jgi:hypothetical protein
MMTPVQAHGVMRTMASDVIGLRFPVDRKGYDVRVDFGGNYETAKVHDDLEMDEKVDGNSQ